MSVADFQMRLGARLAIGGQHPGRGTRNALLALSDSSYLEVVGPDATQTEKGISRWFEIDNLDAARLVTWAVKGTELGKLAERARDRGVHLGPVVEGRRRGSDGSYLRWQFTDPATVVADGLVPFFIDWGNSPHPAASAPRGPELVSLMAEHPEPAAVMRVLSLVGVELQVVLGPRPALVATLRTKRGLVELR